MTKTTNTTKQSSAAKKTTKATAQVSSKKKVETKKLSRLASIVKEEPTMKVGVLGNDFKNALLIVSVGINVFVLTAWITLQVTTLYDVEVATLLFVR